MQSVKKMPSQAEAVQGSQEAKVTRKTVLPKFPGARDLTPVGSNYYALPLRACSWIIMANALNLLEHGTKAPSYPAILLFGPPGVGKSTAVREIASSVAEAKGMKLIDITSSRAQKLLYEVISSCERNHGSRSEVLECIKSTLGSDIYVFLDLRLTEVEPQDLIGLPVKSSDGSVMEYAPPMWAKIFSYVPGILFLDEISNVERPDVLAASYKIMLDRAAGFLKFDPRTLVVAAGNLPKHAPELAKSLPFPLLNRSLVLHVSPPSPDEWYEWTRDRVFEMYSEDPDKLADHMKTLELVYGIMRSLEKINFFTSDARQADINENAPSPRAWTHFVISTPFSMLKEMNDPLVIQSYIAGFVGSSMASFVSPIIETGVKIDVEEIIRDPRGAIERIVENAEASVSKAKGESKSEGLNVIGVLSVVASLTASKLVFLDETPERKAGIARNIAEAILDVVGEEYGAGNAKSVLKSFEHALNNIYAYIKTQHDKFSGGGRLTDWLKKISMERDVVLRTVASMLSGG